MPFPLSHPSGSEKDEIPKPTEPAHTIPDKGGGEDTGKIDDIKKTAYITLNS